MKTRDGGELACWVSGSGPPLLLIHGSISDRTIWEPTRPRLEDRFTVYVLNRRGREGSTPLESVDLEREFREVAAVVDAIGGPVHVLGHSFGAHCALGAALHTNRIRSLVLFEPPAPDPRIAPVAEQIQAMLDEGRTQEALEAFLAGGPGEPPENVERLKRSPLWSTMLALTPTVPLDLNALACHLFDAERFRSIDCPVLYLLGTRSPAHFREISDALAPILADFRLASLPDQQHFANVLAPELFAGEVEKFLS